MSQNYISTTKREWAKKIELWRQSGKSVKAWCRENHVVYTTFLGWRNRLKLNQNVNSTSSSSKNQFIELKEGLKTASGISLECEGVRIHLTSEFDELLLKRCLALLRGVPC
jgi:hypothetical protein